MVWNKRIVDITTLSIDRERFTAVDANGVALQVKAMFKTRCVACETERETYLNLERGKKHPWMCASCAIAAEWRDGAYITSHVDALRAAVTPEKRAKLSAISRRNWQDPAIRTAMSADRDRFAQARKAATTRYVRALADPKRYRTTHGKHIVVDGIMMRSTYEARLALALNMRSLKWVYEPRWFSLSTEKLYMPDFYITDLDLYVEVKGWWRDDAREKFNAFISEYPTLRCALVMREQLEAIERRELELEACIFTSSR